MNSCILNGLLGLGLIVILALVLYLIEDRVKDTKLAKKLVVIVSIVALILLILIFILKPLIKLIQ